MKAKIFLNNEIIFSSNNISAKKLENEVNRQKEIHSCMLMADVVKKGFKVFTSK